MSSIHENYPLTHDKDSSFSHKIPDSLEVIIPKNICSYWKKEAKAMIIAKNQSIEKLKKLIANNNINLSSANQVRLEHSNRFTNNCSLVKLEEIRVLMRLITYAVRMKDSRINS